MSPKSGVKPMAIKVDSLAKTINAKLKEYGNTVTEDLKEGVEQVSTVTVKELRGTSPKETGSYRKGWKKKKAFENATSVRYTVHNATDYQLTHLLEKGHAGVGGTAKGSAPAYPHIAPAEQHAAEKLVKKAKTRVKG